MCIRDRGKADDHSDENRHKTEYHRHIAGGADLGCEDASGNCRDDLPAITGKSGAAGHKATCFPDVYKRQSMTCSTAA